MPVAVGFAQLRTFLLHAAGEVTLAEVQRTMDDVLAHPGLASGSQVLIDGRTVTGTPSAAEVRQIARELTPLISRGLGPITIVTQPGFVYGVARMFAVFAETIHPHVSAFTDMESAQEWLASGDV